MSYCRPPLVLPSLSSCLEFDPGHLLDVAQAAWEEQQSPYALVVEVIQDMQEQVNRIALITCQHVQEAQAKQSQVHNRPATVRELQPGNHVLLLNPNCRFLVHWEGPCTVQHASPVNHLQQQCKHKDTQLCHVNLLKVLSPQNLQGIPWSKEDRT